MHNKKSGLLYSIQISLAGALFAAFVLAISFWSALLKDASFSPAILTQPNPVTFIVDAGHGGRDGGAIGNNGIVEKEINLKVSRALVDYLTLCGESAVMTRKEDALVCDESDPALKGKIKLTDLNNRLKIAEFYPAGVFVSIHMNKFSIEKYNGLQVYFSKNNEKSQNLAQGIQDRVRGILQLENARKIKAAGKNIFLLDRLEIPAVLIECGFLSNVKEAQKLSTPSYQMQLAVVIGDSLLAK